MAICLHYLRLMSFNLMQPPYKCFVFIYVVQYVGTWYISATNIIEFSFVQKVPILFSTLSYLIQRISNQFYKCEPNFSKYSSQRDS